MSGERTGATGRPSVTGVFEEEYAEGMDLDAAVVLGLKALKKATEEEKLNPKTVEIGVVQRDENFRRLEDSEVESFIEKANAA